MQPACEAFHRKVSGGLYDQGQHKPQHSAVRLSIQDTDARRARVPSRLGLLAHCLLPSDTLEKMKRKAPACSSVCLSSQQWRWQCEALSNQEVTQEKTRALFPLPLLLAWLWLPADLGPISPSCAQLSLLPWTHRRTKTVSEFYLCVISGSIHADRSVTLGHMSFPSE